MASATPYRKDKTGSMQTAVNYATAVTVAALNSGTLKLEADPEDHKEVGKELDAFATERAKHIFAELAAIVDADNELFEKLEKEAAGGSSSGNGGGSSRSSGRSGGRSSGGGSGRGRSSSGGRGKSKSKDDDDFAEDGGDYEIKFGAFYDKDEKKGLTLREIDALSKSDAKEYGYSKSGSAYIEYLLKDEHAESDYFQNREAHHNAKLFDQEG